MWPIISKLQELDKLGFYKSADSLEKRIKLAYNLGEYWIDNHGDATYADIEYGDYSHEMLVEQHLLYELGWPFDDTHSLEDANDKFDSYLEYRPELEDYADQIRSIYGDEDPLRENADIMDYLRNICTRPEAECEAMIHGFKDPRTYAMKYMGWYRLAGTNIETWTLTDHDLDIIVRGLYNAYDDEADLFHYNIEVKSMHKFLTDISMDDLSSHDVLRMIGLSPAKKNNDVENLKSLQELAPASRTLDEQRLYTNFPGPENEQLRKMYEKSASSKKN